MKKLKVSIAAIAFLLVAGATFATSNSAKLAPGDCDTTNPFLPVGSGDTDAAVDCPGDGEFCCFLLGTGGQIEEVLP